MARPLFGLWLPSPHPLACSTPGNISPLTIRDPRLRGQGTPFFALAQLYQVFEAQQGAYAGSIPRVKLREEQQKSRVSPSEPRDPGLWLSRKPTQPDTQRDPAAHGLWYSPGDGSQPSKGWGTSEVTHSSRDLRVCQVLEVLPALGAGSYSPVLRLYPHLGDQIELRVSLQGLYLHVIVIIC